MELPQHCTKCQRLGHWELHCPFFPSRPEDLELYQIRSDAAADGIRRREKQQQRGNST